MKLFETKVRQIFHYICPYKSRGIVNPATGRVDPQSAVRKRYADFSEAQKLIVEELKSMAEKRKELKTQVKAARKNRDKLKLSHFEQAIEKVAWKEAVIRNLADSIAWQLIDGRSDLVQWLYSYEYPPSIDESNLASVLQEVNEMNQSDPLSFALISDLTSFVQVGDILRRDMSEILKVIEVKEGEKNIKAIQILGNELAGEYNESTLARLKSVYGSHLTNQVRRIHRQMIKGNRVREIINTGEGADPKTGTHVTVREPQSAPAVYTSELADCLSRLDKEPWAYTIIEGCLMIGCYKGPMKRAGGALLSSLARTFFQANNITVNLIQGLQEPMCVPIFLKPFRENDIFDILFDRTRVFLALNLDGIIEAFQERGAKAGWLPKKETEKLSQRSRSKYERPFVFKGTGRAISIENDKWNLFPSDGSFRKIFYDNFRPSSVVSILLDSLNSQA